MRGFRRHPTEFEGTQKEYFGIWPLFLWVPSNRAAEWNDTFLRVRDHLARAVVTRSD